MKSLVVLKYSIMSYVNSDNSASLFPIWFLIALVSTWKVCWIQVLRGDFLSLSMITGKRFSVFHNWFCLWKFCRWLLLSWGIFLLFLFLPDWSAQWWEWSFDLQLMSKLYFVMFLKSCFINLATPSFGAYILTRVKSS